MSLLTAADKSIFAANGYLVRYDLLTAEQLEAARDAIWTGIPADRDRPETWIDAQSRSPIPSSHPAIRSTVVGSPIGDVIRELVGPKLVVEEGPNPALVFPCGDDDWSPPQGHLDGYHSPGNSMPQGTVKRNAVCVTIYIADVELQGGCFTLWPGSHLKAHDYFKTHSILSLDGGSGVGLFDLGDELQIAGPAGTVCIWHGHLVHSGSKNCSGSIRMALIGRYLRADVNDIAFETPDDTWEYWDGMP